MKKIAHIIARKLLNVADKEELNTLSQWTERSADNRTFTDNLQTYWEAPSLEIPDKNLPDARQRILARINKSEDRRRKKSVYFYLTRVAAAAVLAVVVSGLSIKFAAESGLFSSGNWMEVMTEDGQQSKVTLPDGSTVWLNAATRIRYNTDTKIRRVDLIGEAYFEVQHAPDRPFIVETGNTSVKVLGTKFNVAHYPNSSIVEASLLSGKIAMSLTGQNREYELAPGEKMRYDMETNTFSKVVSNVQKETLWREGVLVFEQVSFNELAKRLERYYAVELIYNTADFKNIHYTGTLHDLSIYKMLEYINLTIPIEYEIDNKTILIKHAVP